MERPSQQRIAAAISHLRDAELEIIFAGPCTKLGEPRSSTWGTVARSLTAACNALANPEHEATLWDHLADLRAAVSREDTTEAMALVDDALQTLWAGDLWPGPMPVDVDSYCQQVVR